MLFFGEALGLRHDTACRPPLAGLHYPDSTDCSNLGLLHIGERPVTVLQYNFLGATGIEVSVIGLGCSGASRMGLAAGGTQSDAERLIHMGLDFGINVIDMSGVLSGTEPVVARAIQSRRNSIVLSTKIILGPLAWPFSETRTAARISSWIGAATSFVAGEGALIRRVENSLRLLGVEQIDIVSLHAVTPGQYPAALQRCRPILERLKRDGKIRAFGITEAFLRDPSHRMLSRAIGDGGFQTVMAGFNILNSSAGPAVFLPAMRREVGTIAMFAVRRMLKSPALFKEAVTEINRKRPDFPPISADGLLALMADHGVSGLTEAAHRYCRHESGADVVLTGTGDLQHLKQNVAACLAPPLPEPVRSAFREAFGSVDFATAN